jgi:hypothetical protein
MRETGMREQERHDATRRITEKRVLIRTFRKEGFRERERLGVHAKLVGRRPERRTPIKRIQNRIAAVRVEELRRVLERGIVDDRGFAPCLHLQQQLTDQRGLARDFDPHRDFELSLTDDELTVEERAAAGGASPDDFVLDV